MKKASIIIMMVIVVLLGAGFLYFVRPFGSRCEAYSGSYGFPAFCPWSRCRRLPGVPIPPTERNGLISEGYRSSDFCASWHKVRQCPVSATTAILNNNYEKPSFIYNIEDKGRLMALRPEQFDESWIQNNCPPVQVAE